MSSVFKAFKALLLTVTAYLVQVCVMKYLAVGGITGSVLFAMLAIITVSLGKKYTFCASCIIGMLMESMLSNVPGLYIIAYPVIAMICATFFADMSDRQRERRRMLNDLRRSRHGEGKGARKLFNRLTGINRDGDLPAHLRIVLCAVLMDLILNAVLIAYMYLIGVDMSFTHVGRALASIVYTAALTAVLMVPVRYFLGMYPKRRKREVGGELV